MSSAAGRLRSAVFRKRGHLQKFRRQRVRSSRPARNHPSTISLTSLPYLRDKGYIARAQCSHLFITPLFQRFYLQLFLIQDFPKNFSSILLIAIDHRGRGGALILTYYEYRVPRCQHIKTNGTQCGSPAMRNGEYCYFHRRWRMTTVDLSHSAHHVTTEFVLPVLEDADSIQITLGQIMRMIVCRQVDTKSAGLLLYALQIASANLRRTHFEPYHRNVTVDLFRVPERVIGDEAWSPSDFKDAGVGRAPSPAAPSAAKESCVVATLPEPQPEALSPAKETHVARTPSSAKESCAAPTPPEPAESALARNSTRARFQCAYLFPSFRHRTARFARSRPRNSPRSEGRLARRKNTI